MSAANLPERARLHRALQGELPGAPGADGDGDHRDGDRREQVEGCGGEERDP